MCVWEKACTSGTRCCKSCIDQDTTPICTTCVTLRKQRQGVSPPYGEWNLPKNGYSRIKPGEADDEAEKIVVTKKCYWDGRLPRFDTQQHLNDSGMLLTTARGRNIGCRLEAWNHMADHVNSMMLPVLATFYEHNYRAMMLEASDSRFYVDVVQKMLSRVKMEAYGTCFTMGNLEGSMAFSSMGPTYWAEVSLLLCSG